MYIVLSYIIHYALMYSTSIEGLRSFVYRTTLVGTLSRPGRYQERQRVGYATVSLSSCVLFDYRQTYLIIDRLNGVRYMSVSVRAMNMVPLTCSLLW